MPATPKRGRRFGGSSAHQKSMMANLVSSLILAEAITTTEAKAKEIRRMAEKVITQGKGGTLHNRRQALAVLTDEDIVRKLFDELATRYEDRPGGYTRITMLCERRCLAPRMASMELLP